MIYLHWAFSYSCSMLSSTSLSEVSRLKPGEPSTLITPFNLFSIGLSTLIKLTESTERNWVEPSFLFNLLLPASYVWTVHCTIWTSHLNSNLTNWGWPMSSVGLPCTSRILLQVVANEVDWLLFLPKVRSSAFDRLSRLLSDKKSGHTIPNSKPNPLFFTAGRNIFFGNVMTRKSISIYFWSSSIYPYWTNGDLNSPEKEWSAIVILLNALTMVSLLFDGGEGVGGKGCYLQYYVVSKTGSYRYYYCIYPRLPRQSTR